MRASSEHGFTLIELMIVVAIIGILAAVAIPSFQRFQMRARIAESRINLAALRGAEGSYFAERGQYADVVPVPAGGLTTTKRVWAACPSSLAPTSPGQCLLGFASEGPTYFRYAARNTTGSNVGTGNVSYFADAAGDLDGDGVPSIWGLEVPTLNSVAPTGLAAPNGCTAVYDGSGNPGLLGQIGPCGVGMGNAIF